MKMETFQVEPVKEEGFLVPVKFRTEDVARVVEAETTVLEIVPATYEWVEETFVVTPEYQEEVYIPASYKTVTEEIQVEPARVTCMRKLGQEKRINGISTEWCYMTEAFPARTRTITKQVLDVDARIEKRVVAAVTRTIKVRKEVNAAEVRKIVIPEKTEMIKRQVLVNAPVIELRAVPARTIEIETLVMAVPADKRKVNVPAIVETMTQRVLDRPAQLVWKLMTVQTCLGRYPSVPGIPMQD